MPFRRAIGSVTATMATFALPMSPRLVSGVAHVEQAMKDFLQ